MWNRQYPFVGAGRVASVAFALNGVVVGVLLARVIPNAPNAIVNAIIWGILAAGVAFLVFATDAQQRPPSIRQGAAADGIITGVIAGSLGMLLELLASSGAGATGTGGPGTLHAIELALASAIFGALDGAVLGLILCTAGGQQLLATRHVVKVSRKHGGGAKVRAPQKPRRRR